MKRITIQTTLEPPKVRPSSLVWLLIRYFVHKLDLQKSLFVSSFLTYGVGDGVTAVYMMEQRGVVGESNPAVRFMYANSGKNGVVTLKMWFALVILFMVWSISRQMKAYWTINGFLFALTLGGLMAMRANMMAAHGIEPPSPGSVIAAFLVLVILFILTGDLLDKFNEPGRVRNKAF